MATTILECFLPIERIQSEFMLLAQRHKGRLIKPSCFVLTGQKLSKRNHKLIPTYDSNIHYSMTTKNKGCNDENTPTGTEQEISMGKTLSISVHT